MSKIAVIGAAGRGRSTLCRQLSGLLAIPLFQRNKVIAAAQAEADHATVYHVRSPRDMETVLAAARRTIAAQ